MSDLPGNAMLIKALAEDARSLSPEVFEDKHGSGFLMLTATRFPGDGATSGTEVLLDSDGDAGGRTASLTLVVYPLRRQDGAPSHLVMLGRAADQDVVVPDPSVSRVHAFAKCEADGVFLLQDMGSSNGTSVNGRSVPTRGAGPPTALKPGDTVRLGQVDFTFTDARSLREFATQIGS